MLVASSINTAKKQLDLVTAFFKDTGMTFGDDKCVNQQIWRTIHFLEKAWEMWGNIEISILQQTKWEEII